MTSQIQVGCSRPFYWVHSVASPATSRISIVESIVFADFFLKLMTMLVSHVKSHVILDYFVFRSVLFVVDLVLVLYARCQSVEECTTTRVQWLLGRIR